MASCNPVIWRCCGPWWPAWIGAAEGLGEQSGSGPGDWSRPHQHRQRFTGPAQAPGDGGLERRQAKPPALLMRQSSNGGGHRRPASAKDAARSVHSGPGLRLVSGCRQTPAIRPVAVLSQQGDSLLLALLSSAYGAQLGVPAEREGLGATAIAATEAIHLPLCGDNSQPLLPQYQLLSLVLGQGVAQLYLARGERSAYHTPGHLVVGE